MQTSEIGVARERESLRSALGEIGERKRYVGAASAPLTSIVAGEAYDERSAGTKLNPPLGDVTDK